MEKALKKRIAEAKTKGLSTKEKEWLRMREQVVKERKAEIKKRLKNVFGDAKKILDNFADTTERIIEQSKKQATAQKPKGKKKVQKKKKTIKKKATKKKQTKRR